MRLTSDKKLRAVGVVVAGLALVWVATQLMPGLNGVAPRRHRLESASLALGAGLLLLASMKPWRMQARAVESVRGREALWAGALALLAAIWWSWVLWLGPLSDDFVIRQWVIDRNWLPATWPFARPLPLRLWGAVIAVGGGWKALHLINVMLHAANVSMVFRLGRIGFGTTGGAVAALVFLVFPAHVEAVGWTAGVFDVASTTGVLFALNAWCARLRTSARLGLVCCGMACALFSKESAIVLPVLLLLVDRTILGGPWRRGHALVAACAACLSALYLAWRAIASDAIGDHLSQLPQTRYQVKDLLVRPFGALAAPVRTDDGEYLLATLSALAVLAIVAVTLRSSWTPTNPKYQPATISAGLRVGLIWPLVAVAPLLMQFFVSSSLEGSRYTYLPSVGLALFVGSTVATSGGAWRRVAWASVSVLIGVWSLAGLGERPIWRQAATTRDAFLVQVARLAATRGCATVELLSAPDSVRGAYVFREGAALAVREVVPARPGSVVCIARWEGGEVQPVE